MKFFLIVLSAVAVVKGSDSGFASSYNSVSGKQYHPQGWNTEIHPQHIPVIDKHGVPEETPEVIAAKHHFYAEYSKAAALAAEHPDPLDGQYVEEKAWPSNNRWKSDNSGWTAANNAESDWTAAKSGWAAAKSGWTAAKNGNGANSGWQVASKGWTGANKGWNEANNAWNAANNAWKGAVSEVQSHVQYNSAWEVNKGLTSHAPIDTHEVQAAKAAHFQAHAAALSRASSHKHGLYKRSASGWSQPKYQGPIHVPEITAHGVPADTPEVQKAKMNHLHILNEATHKAHASGYVEEDHSAWKPSNNHGHGQTYGPPQAAAAWPSTPINVAYKVNHEETPKWHGPEHHTVLDHNGVPVDTHEVQHARKAHLAVLAAESAKHAGWEGAQKKW